MNIEVGKTYTNGKLSRTVSRIEGRGMVYYANQKGENKSCWITTFEDWVSEGKRNNKKLDASLKEKIEKINKTLMDLENWSTNGLMYSNAIELLEEYKSTLIKQ